MFQVMLGKWDGKEVHFELKEGARPGLVVYHECISRLL
jgi:hypothetical protein